MRACTRWPGVPTVKSMSVIMPIRLITRILPDSNTPSIIIVVVIIAGMPMPLSRRLHVKLLDFTVCTPLIAQCNSNGDTDAYIIRLHGLFKCVIFENFVLFVCSLFCLLQLNIACPKNSSCLFRTVCFPFW